MQLVGHRGARFEAPENTLGGFQHLKKIGVKAVEFDVRQLTTGELVVIHDDNLKRTAGVAVPIYGTKLNELQQYSQTYQWEEWPTFEKLPLLTEVLDQMIDFDHIEVEIKSVDSEVLAEQISATLLKVFNQRPARQQVAITFTSFDTKVLSAINQQKVSASKNLSTSIKNSPKTGLLIEQSLSKEQILHLLKSLNCSQLGPRNDLVNEDLVRAIKHHHYGISVWTVNELERAKELVRWGIDSLITDMPTHMLKSNSTFF